MDRYKFAISFKVKEEEKKEFHDLLDDLGSVVFLKDIPETEIGSVLSKSDVLIAWNPAREIKNIPRDNLLRIKFVQLLSAGFDHVDFRQFPDKCIIACNSGAYAEPMAEHILAMILALSKNLMNNHKKLADGLFDQLTVNRAVNGAVCGIIGYGGIGKASAKLLRAFGAEIYGINTSGKSNDELGFIGTLKDLDFVLKKSDIILVSIPLNKETLNLITKRELELMKPDGIIVNVARGPIINERDLYNHLKTNHNFLAGIDAWWNEPFVNGSFKLNYPFLELLNFLGSPHNSAVVPGALKNGATLAIRNVLNYLHGRNVRGIIDKQEQHL